MKRTLVLIAVLLLTGIPAWAEEPAIVDAGGGGCMLPDLASLTAEELPAAALAAGFQLVTSAAAAVPLCPVTFHCNSIGNCAAGPLCALSDIGQCCSSGGFRLCCLSGTIKVTRCPCRCTSTLCSSQCVASDEVNWSCS